MTDGSMKDGGVESRVADVCGVAPRRYPRATDPRWQGGKTGGETAETDPAKARQPANPVPGLAVRRNHCRFSRAVESS